MPQNKAQSKRVLFLDYDGVVNTPMWNEKGTSCTYNFPKDGKVNNFQAVQWISEFCKKFHYDIVVSSSWRDCSNYKECLINGGLREGIEIIGATPYFTQGSRGDEIHCWLTQHPEVKYYLIVDDCETMRAEQYQHCIQTDEAVGFTMTDYQKACDIALRDRGHGNSFWNVENPVPVGRIDLLSCDGSVRESLVFTDDEIGAFQRRVRQAGTLHENVRVVVYRNDDGEACFDTDYMQNFHNVEIEDAHKAPTSRQNKEEINYENNEL